MVRIFISCFPGGALLKSASVGRPMAGISYSPVKPPTALTISLPYGNLKVSFINNRARRFDSPLDL